MRGFTGNQLYSSFLIRGGFSNSTVWTRSAFADLLTAAAPEVWRLLVESWEDYFLEEHTEFTTEIDTETYRMPDDFWRLRKLEVSVSEAVLDNEDQDFRRMTRVDLDRLNRLRKESGEPRVYHLRGVTLQVDSGSYQGVLRRPCFILAPRPTAERRIRITYVPVPPKFFEDIDQDDNPIISNSEGSEIWDGVCGYESLLLEHCIYLAYKRSKMPVTECAQEIARLSQDLKNTAPNWDAFQSETIADHVRANENGLAYWDEEDL